jgi:hypothetical protein
VVVEKIPVGGLISKGARMVGVQSSDLIEQESSWGAEALTIAEIAEPSRTASNYCFAGARSATVGLVLLEDRWDREKEEQSAHYLAVAAEHHIDLVFVLLVRYPHWVPAAASAVAVEA